MAPAIWPSLVLALAAWVVALSRTLVLSVHGAGDGAQLAAALERRLLRGDRARALALCRALPRCWAAELALCALCDDVPEAELASVLEELRGDYRVRVQTGIGALGSLSRMAFPLALGGAILALSSALGGVTEVTQVERALGSALQCMTAGVLTTVFCRVSADWLRKQGARRLHELAAVTRAITHAIQTCSART